MSEQRRAWAGALLAAAVLFGLWLAFRAGHEQAVDSGADVKLERIAVALREPKDALQVYRLSGDVRTTSIVKGGPFNLLEGRLTASQPWSVAYFVDLKRLGLNDYIWDARTRTLRVRVPDVYAEPPNIDESRGKVSYSGALITRNMQEQLSHGVAVGARNQAQAEALKPENVAAARAQARKAIATNLQGPLTLATGERVQVTVEFASERPEQWDVSRSIAEVLKQQEGR